MRSFKSDLAKVSESGYSLLSIAQPYLLSAHVILLSQLKHRRKLKGIQSIRPE